MPTKVKQRRTKANCRAKELVVDSFAGGGGTSLGIARALGREPDVAINHDPDALAMHAANHPDTLHLPEDVWKVPPRAILRLRKRKGQWQLPPEGWQEWPARHRVGLLWASPDCKHFSRAKGSKPVNKSIRSLAWVICKWAAEVKPRLIFLENVREFADWGPVVPAWRCADCHWRGTEGQAVLVRTRRKCPRCESRRLKATDELIPCPDRKGLTFRRFVARLKSLGYAVEWRNLNAADYGAPTHRRRLFLIARCDGAPIVWPEPTHGDPKKLGGTPLFEQLTPWRTAAECIDWSMPCPSIFDRKRPLAEKTMRRIAMGIKRYVLDSAEPFIVRYNTEKSEGDNRTQAIDEPLSTIDTQNRFAVASPYLVPLTHDGDDRTRSMAEPLPTITTAHRGEIAVVSPSLVQVAHGEGKNGRWSDSTGNIQSPLGTIHAGGNNHALVSAFLAKHFGGVVGVPVDTPLPTTTTRGTQTQVVSANLVRMNHGEKQWNDVREPLVTVTSQGNKHGLVAANLVRFNHDDAGVPVDAPLSTQTANNHAALVYSFLVKYFGTAIGANLLDPLPTATGKDRFGLVTVTIRGELWVIVDIGMRMLSPRELARAQGFPDSYQLTGTKSNQVARIGNSVCPPIAEALVRANYSDLIAGAV